MWFQQGVGTTVTENISLPENFLQKNMVLLNYEVVFTTLTGPIEYVRTELKSPGLVSSRVVCHS